MNYTDLLTELQIELKRNWSKCSPVDKFIGKHIDNLSEWGKEEFFCLYKQMPDEWSKSSLAGEIIKGNFSKILNSKQ